MPALRTAPILRRLGAFVAVAGWLWLASLTIAQLAGADVRRHHFEPPGLLLGAGLLLLAAASWRAHPLPAVPPPTGRGWTLVVPAAAAFAAYAWALWLGPFSDDYVLRAWALAGDWTPASWPFVRPLPLVTWRAILATGAGWPGLHALNVALHVLVSALTARLAATGLRSTPAGIAAGTIVALFPASTEAVAWNAGVFDLMAAAAVLGAVTLAVAARRGSPARDAALAACCVAGVLAKESAVAIPAILLLVASCAAPDPDTRRARVRAVLVASVVTGIYLVVRVVSSPAVAAHMQAWPSDRRAWKDLIVRPYAAVLLPFRTDEGHGLLLYAAALLTLVLVALLLERLGAARHADTEGEPPIGAVTGVAIAWILIGALPLLADFFVSGTLEGSRFLYLPAIGLALLLAAPFAAARWRTRETVTLVCLVGLLVTYAVARKGERTIRVEAARTRDDLLAAAGRLAREQGCGALTVHDAPDNVRGVYVFREGLREALAGVAVSGGAPCAARWTNGTLVPEP